MPQSIPAGLTADHVRRALYRVFDFADDPRLYVLPGSILEACRLDPVQYRAAIGPALADESAS